MDGDRLSLYAGEQPVQSDKLAGGLPKCGSRPRSDAPDTFQPSPLAAPGASSSGCDLRQAALSIAITSAGAVAGVAASSLVLAAGSGAGSAAAAGAGALTDALGAGAAAAARFLLGDSGATVVHGASRAASFSVRQAVRRGSTTTAYAASLAAGAGAAVAVSLGAHALGGAGRAAARSGRFLYARAPSVGDIVSAVGGLLAVSTPVGGGDEDGGGDGGCSNTASEDDGSDGGSTADVDAEGRPQASPLFASQSPPLVDVAFADDDCDVGVDAGAAYNPFAAGSHTPSAPRHACSNVPRLLRHRLPTPSPMTAAGSPLPHSNGDDIWAPSKHGAADSAPHAQRSLPTALADASARAAALLSAGAEFVVSRVHTRVMAPPPPPTSPSGRDGDGGDRSSGGLPPSTTLSAAELLPRPAVMFTSNLSYTSSYSSSGSGGSGGGVDDDGGGGRAGSVEARSDIDDGGQASVDAAVDIDDGGDGVPFATAAGNPAAAPLEEGDSWVEL